MSSSTVSPQTTYSTTMRASGNFDKSVEEMKPSKSDINWLIMDYLVSEGYPGAAEKFAQETNLCPAATVETIRERVKIRTAIHAGKVEEAIELINDADAEILDNDSLLHFQLLQLQLIEIIRGILANNPSSQNIPAQDFLPAIQFATEQLSPRAPTDVNYQRALENTMALMIFQPEKMPQEFRELLDVRLREKVATDVNKAILSARGERAEAKIKQLIRARAWAEVQAREAKADLPAHIPIGLDVADEMNGDAVMT
ncbi:CTLH/CRA C-terminal to lish motif domain-containing protein [Neohortaea acidophila]|uniref:CTLH/CRA C-terminal to lish motif domain-containing protein n=1 Tax=Neohortaea acidophila TaxID=245834 RepID=A0A6A6PT33_9PEZI|nr:CTLH/CRA C-terminal to lish motif domain-containing protein [Neohortaea acidophila]KAF2483142.1 CTLH/CRA C-terminal to lish motif domain-containing protein [Neohortaea acidophila]